MANTIELIKNFNTLFSTLIQQVSPFIGNNYYHLYNTVIKANASIGIKTFYHYSLPHKQQILSKDEHFFLDDENIKEIAKENHNNETLLEIVDKIKHIWNSLDKESKNNLWDMITGLFLLAQEYGSLKNL